MAVDINEFHVLAERAKTVGITPPAVRRIAYEGPDGQMLSALLFGHREPRVTFLHGAGLNAHTWDAVVLRLGQPSLVIDLPGHGDSSWREDADYSPRTNAATIAEGLAQWTTSPQLVVGQSLGGLTAAALAARHPTLVTGVILVDVTPDVDMSPGLDSLREFFSGPSDFATRDEIVDRALAFRLGGSREDTERGVFFNTRITRNGRVEWKHHFAHLAARALAPERRAEAMGREAGWDDLHAVGVPLVLVHARRGFLSEKNAIEFADRLPSATIIRVDATHNVQESAPAVLAELIAAQLVKYDAKSRNTGA